MDATLEICFNTRECSNDVRDILDKAFLNGQVIQGISIFGLHGQFRIAQSTYAPTEVGGLCSYTLLGYLDERKLEAKTMQYNEFDRGRNDALVGNLPSTGMTNSYYNGYASVVEARGGSIDLGATPLPEENKESA